jgi:cation diffusion facilitator family transporter
MPPVPHSHDFSAPSAAAERRTWIVVGLTASMMVVEIVGGWLFNSMAVLADGWHMSTHAAALGIAGVAYAYSRTRASDPRFAFGPWKAEALGGFTSAILLVVVALVMGWQSVTRLFHPLAIHYGQALAIAAVGLAVNLVSALILGGGHSHGHDDEHAAHGHAHHHHDDHGRHHGHRHDLNLRAAYLHVIADAATSVGAIIALVVAWFFGFTLLDPVMGLVGGVLICWWSWGLLRDTTRVLLDREMDAAVVAQVRRALESDRHTRITDLHVWRVGRAAYACAIALETETGKSADDYRDLLKPVAAIVHTTIEVGSARR